MYQLNDKDRRSIKLQIIPQFALSLGLFLYGAIANSDSIAFAGISVALGALCYGVVQGCVRAGIVIELLSYYPIDLRGSRFEQEMELERIPVLPSLSVVMQPSIGMILYSN
jgi:hypothetical protein